MKENDLKRVPGQLVAQDRLDVFVVVRIFSHTMVSPKSGTTVVSKRVNRYLQTRTRNSLVFPGGRQGPVTAHFIWTSSGWVGDVNTRRPCNGGSLQISVNAVGAPPSSK